MKLIYQDCGLNWAVGIEGSPEEIEGQFDSFFHHGAIDQTAVLHSLCDRFAYVWTTEEKLRKYFVNSSIHLLLNEVTLRLCKRKVAEQSSGHWATWTGKKGGVMPYARKLAQTRFNQMVSERWMKFGANAHDGIIGSRNGQGTVYTLGEVSAEDLSDSDA